MTGLVIGHRFALAPDFVTKTAAILAQRRKGKTYTAAVIAEAMVQAKQPFVALDPTGAWWGLRANAAGDGPGLPVVVLGGQHGDVPLERTGGRLIADLVVEEPGYYVIDFSLFESGEAERQFAVDFAERLYRVKGQAGKDFPLHLFVDEADRFIPQQIRKGTGETSPRLLGAFETIVRRGGIRGLGTTLISQRAAVVNKNVLEMIDVLIALRTVGPNDQAAIKAYVKTHGTETEVTAMMSALSSLALGEAFVWEPGGDVFERVAIRPRRTFNSSATPTPGVTRVEPKRLAAVDLAKLQERMAATIERSKADDPKELRKTIARLEREARDRPAAVPERVEVPVIPGETIEQIKMLVGKGALMMAALDEWRPVLDAIQQQAVAITQALTRIDEQSRATPRRREPDPGGRVAPRAATTRPAPRMPVNGDGTLSKGERAILVAVAQHEDGVTRDQLTVLCGYKRSSRDTYLQRLQAGGYVKQAGVWILATNAGLEALGPDFEPLPTGAELLTYWLDRLSGGERAILDAVAGTMPHGLSRDGISQVTDYKRSSRDTYIQRLVSRKLLVQVPGGLQLSPTLIG